MDTPKRAPPQPAASASAQQQQQIETPCASKFEESPVFNYINSLSPIIPVKSVHITQTFHQSINFSCIPPIFTSPHVSVPHKETTRPMTTRVPLSDLSRQDLPSGEAGEQGNINNNIICSGPSSNVVNMSGCYPATKDSGRLLPYTLPGEPSSSGHHPPAACSASMPVNDPPSSHQAFQYDCGGSPNHDTTTTSAAPCFSGGSGYRFVIGSTSLIEFVHEGLEETAMMQTMQPDMGAPQGVADHVSSQNQEAPPPECDWEDLIADDAEPMLIFDPTHEHDAYREQFPDFPDLDSSVSCQSGMLVDDNAVDYARAQTLVPSGETHRLHSLNASTELPLDHKIENSNRMETDHTPLDFSVCQTNMAKSSSCDVLGGKVCDQVSASDKANSQNQRGMRRRCLVFEMAGQRKNMQNGPNCSSLTPSQHHAKASSDDRQSAPKKPGLGAPKGMLPSIGLHLNSLASTSKEVVISQDTLDSGNQLIRMPYPICQYPLPSSHETALAPCFLSNDAGSSDVEVQDLQIVQDSTQENASGDGEELMSSSPKKKKRKSESTSDSEGCKRCHCKKSKCLKLYCECFAAGVYCVEPCTCQGCFNKPMHEDTVLATRKQIESRNPLAFAPKVIRSSEPVPESGEDANKTPASARHKRGCNCKKSSCLKKYCECYQGGVGCSISCRCEGCKNTFGRKEGITPISINDPEPEEKELSLVVYRDVEKTDGPPGTGVRGADQFSDCTLPLTPSTQTIRPHFPFVSTGKPPRASTPAIAPSRKLIAIKALSGSDSKTKLENKPQVPSDDDTPEILLTEHMSSGVKVVSPNKKRVSPPHAAIVVSPSPSRKGCRKLILKSIPSFPSLTSDSTNETTMGISSSSLNPQLLS